MEATTILTRGRGSGADEYLVFRGRWVHGCNYCHGRPPTPPSSEVTSRIVAVGAATRSGAGLRAAMQRTDLGGVMDHLFVDPTLDEAALEAIRRYLIDVRDGALPDPVRFDKAGESRTLTLRNERSSRDAPASIALLRASGPFVVDARRSSCRRAARIGGQSSCRLVLRAVAGAAAGVSGTLDWQLAPSPGLEPALRSVALRLGG